MLASGAVSCLDPRYAPPMAESESLSTARLIDGRALGTVVRTSIAERIAAGNRPVRLDGAGRAEPKSGGKSGQNGAQRGFLRHFSKHANGLPDQDGVIGMGTISLV